MSGAPRFDRLRIVDWSNGHQAMTDDVALLKKIVDETDTFFRERLSQHGFDAPHLVFAIAPNGDAIARSNVRLQALRAMAASLRASARQAVVDEEG